MTIRDEERVYELQVYLHAVKECAMCHVRQRVDEFGGYCVQPCEECIAHLRRHKRARWR